MSQTKQLNDALDRCQHYIGHFLKHASAIDLDQLNTNERLMILAFYDELLALLYDNYNLFRFDPLSGNGHGEN